LKKLQTLKENTVKYNDEIRKIIDQTVNADIHTILNEVSELLAKVSKGNIKYFNQYFENA